MKKIIFTMMVFASLANVSAQLKVDSAGRVGIGTANPQYRLDVAGDTRVSGNIYLESDSNIIATINDYIPITFMVNGGFGGSTGSNEISNVSFGYSSHPNGASNWNTAIGYHALPSNTTGSGNTANGAMTLYENTTGFDNSAQGRRALLRNTTGSANTANGTASLYYNTTGNANTANGIDALYYNTTGHGNTASGVGALSSNTTGNNNTAIGRSSGVTANNLSNATAIGYETKATSSDQVRIGNSSVTSIGGYADWTNFSDKRAKKNIREDVPGLAFINRLQPVTYNLDLNALDGLLKTDRTKKSGGDEFEESLSPELEEIKRKAREAKEKQVQTGFIAQDVEKTAQSIGYDFSGVDVDEIGIYGLRYAEFVVPLVKAVQELSAQVSELTALVNSLQGKDADPALLKSGSAGESVTGLQDLTVNGASLQQNVPNLFSQSTVIRYTLPQACKSAQIVIVHPSGNVVRQIPLAASGGTDSITIEGGALSAGAYYYSLYVDGSLVDTKQMILTK